MGKPYGITAFQQLPSCEGYESMSRVVGEEREFSGDIVGPKRAELGLEHPN
jgi:hypothetical protein